MFDSFSFRDSTVRGFCRRLLHATKQIAATAHCEATDVKILKWVEMKK